MIFTPVNNYLYVKNIVEEGLEESGILLPTDYRAVDNPFMVVELLESHLGASGAMWTTGLHLVVEAHMLRDIQHNGETHTVVKENHVIGVLLDKD